MYKRTKLGNIKRSCINTAVQYFVALKGYGKRSQAMLSKMRAESLCLTISASFAQSSSPKAPPENASKP